MGEISPSRIGALRTQGEAVQEEPPRKRRAAKAVAASGGALPIPRISEEAEEGEKHQLDEMA